MKELTTPEEVGHEVGLSTRQILKYIKSGRLKAIKDRRQYIITRANADAFIKWYETTQPKPGPDPKS